MTAKNNGTRILVVDDSASVAELIREMLLSLGYQVDLLLSVKEALAQFQPGKFDLVITDYTMPGMTGVEFSRALKAASPTQQVLLITGSAFAMSDDESRALPVDAILQKPFSSEEFFEAVEKTLPKPQIIPGTSLDERPRL